MKYFPVDVDVFLASASFLLVLGAPPSAIGSSPSGSSGDRGGGDAPAAWVPTIADGPVGMPEAGAELRRSRHTSLTPLNRESWNLCMAAVQEDSVR